MMGNSKYETKCIMLWTMIVVGVLLGSNYSYAITGSMGQGPSEGDGDQSNGIPFVIPTNQTYTGAFAYSIPIKVPPGRNAMNPNLALAYSNYAGNSWLGQGWNLGLGTIQRSTKYGVDYSLNDFVAMTNGANQELIQKDEWGTNYFGAKIEDAFTKHLFNSTTNGWEVVVKNGTKYFYGSTENSRQDDPNNSNRIFKWCLDKIQDTNNNYLTVTYLKDQGQIYPDRIDYTFHNSLTATNFVKFYLEDRPDTSLSYASKFLVRTAKRLKTIDVMASGERVRAYSLSYSTSSRNLQSLLISIQEHGNDATVDAIGNVSGDHSLPPINTSYTSSSDDGEYTLPVVYNVMGTDGYDDHWRFAFGDVNGDNKTDAIAYFIGDDRGTRLNVALSNGNGTFQKPYIQTTHATDGYDWRWRFTFADVNGDNKIDAIAYCIGTDDGARLHVGFGKADGTFNKPFVTTNIRTSGYDERWDFAFADVNGDGRTDAIAYHIGVDDGTILHVSFANIDGTYTKPVVQTEHIREGYDAPWKFDFADINGDGCADAIANFIGDSRGAYIHVALSNKDGTFAKPYIKTTYATDGYSSNWKFNFADVNGDGFTDAVANFIRDDDGTRLNVSLSKGDGTFGPMISTNHSYSNYNNYWTFDFGDVNGDGKVDAIANFIGHEKGDGDGARVQIALSKGDGTFTTPFISTIMAYDGYHGPKWKWAFADVSGDGKTDAVAYMIGVDDGTQLISSLSKEPISNLLNTIENGLGATTTIEYAHSSQFDNSNMPFVVHPVLSIKTNDGFDNESIVTYSYSDAFFDIPSREFRGFNYSKQINPDQSIVETWFHQDEFLKGRPYRSTRREPGDAGNMLIQKEMTWEKIFLNEPENTNPFVKLSNKRTEYEGNGSLFTQENHTYDDTNGNLLTTVISGTNVESITTTNQFDNYGDWIWRKTRETIEGSTSGKVRETESGHESLTGNLLFEEFWLNTGANPRVTMTYDEYGNPVTQTDARGNTTTTEYDTLVQTFPVKVTQPETAGVAHITENEYDFRYGVVKRSKDENDNWTAYDFDEFGRPILVENPDGGKTISRYFDDVVPRYVKNQVLVNDNPEAYIDTYEYFDGLNRSIQTISLGENGKSIVTKTHYDNMGRKDRVDGPFFDTVIGWPISVPADQPYEQTTFDHQGRPIQVESPHGEYGTITTISSYIGFSTTTTDPDNAQKTEIKDHLGRIVQVVEHADQGQQNTYYTYNAVGDLLTVTDPMGNITTMVYDTLGRQTSIDDPNMGFWEYTYDLNGNLLTQTDAKNQTITLEYDELNRTKLKTYSTSDPSVVYTYDNFSIPNGIGRLYTETNTLVTKTVNAFDEMGRETSISKSFDGNPNTFSIDFTYDLAGKVTSKTYPDSSQVDYIFYPETSLLNRIEDPVNTIIYAECEDYTPAGKIGNVYHENGTQTTYSYDSKSTKLQSIQTENPTLGLLQDKVYKYSRAGDIIEITDNINNITRNYAYDKLHRLISETSSEDTYTGLDPVSLTGYHDNADHVHAVSEMNLNNVLYSLEYDDNGNTISGPDFSDPLNVATRNTTYNADNMPIRIEHIKNGITTTTDFSYDGNSQRAKKLVQSGSTTWYISDDYEIIDNVNTKYIFVGTLRAAKVTPAETHFFHKDHLNSSSVITTHPTGDTAETTTYLPFGFTREHTGDEISDYKFTDQELDTSTGLYNYDARLYDPLISIFGIPDYVTPDWYVPQKLNRYSYCRNNPLIYIDPSGNVEFNFKTGSISSFSSDAWQTHNLLSSDISAAWANQEYGSVAMGIPLFLANYLTILPTSYAADMIIGAPYNSGIKSMAGWVHGDWDTALEGNIELAGLTVFAKVGNSKINYNSALKSGSIWDKIPTQRGIEIEKALSKTDYKGWFHVGELFNKKFPLVDFQKGNTLVSLKTVHTAGKTWMGRMQKHIADLGSGRAFVNGQKANMVLDLRVQPGGSSTASSLIQYGRKHNVTVIVKDFH